MKRSLSSALLFAAAAVSLPAAAQFAKPEDAIKYRKAAMTMMNTHVGRLFGMANGRIPFDAKTAAVQSKSPELIAAVGDFYDSLRPEQQQKVREFMQRGRHGWGR